MATAEARSKKTLRAQAEILERLARMEAKLDEVLTRPDPASEAAAEPEPAAAFEAASGLDLTATNRSISGGNPPSPRPKGR